MKLKNLKLIALAVFVFSLAANGFAKKPKYVFLMIGDGMGASQRQTAEYYNQHISWGMGEKLIMNNLPVTGINITNSADNYVTKSAAAGTALATGYKTNNGMLGILPNGEKLKTIAEAAKNRGWKIGIISSARLTHATPASFMAHNKDRDAENEIAEDILNFQADFMAAGGYRHFVSKNGLFKSKRKDNKDLIMGFKRKGYKIFIGENSSDDFLNYKPQKNDKILALFTYSHLPYEIERKKTPSLDQITQKAINFLEETKKPFFMMVEGGRIDHACHANDIATAIIDTLAFNEAVEKVYDFYKKHPKKTLIIVTADHETGGLGLSHPTKYYFNPEPITKIKISAEEGFKKLDSIKPNDVMPFIEENFGLNDLTKKEEQQILDAINEEAKNPNKEYAYANERPIAKAASAIIGQRSGTGWTTEKHTAEPVILTAEGVGAEKFVGYIDNTEIAKRLADLMGVELSKF
jgi:alkaline phosphatase